MKRFARHWRNILIALSLVLCAVVIGLWARADGSLRCIDFVTSRGNLWRACVSPGVGLLHLGGMPVRVPRAQVIVRRGGAPWPIFVTHLLRVHRVGTLGLFYEQGTTSVLIGPDGTVLRPPLPPGPFGPKDFSPPRPYWQLYIPHWAAALILALAPLAAIFVRVKRTAVRRYRVRCNKCPACSYDLRATAGRCPECGRVP